jgi:hypothetical protein
MTTQCEFGPFVPLPGNNQRHSSGFITFNETPSVMENVQIDGKIIKGESIAQQDKDKMSQNGGGMSYANINESLNCDNIHPEYPQDRYTDAQSDCPSSYHNHVLTRYTLANIDNSPMFHALSTEHQKFATGSHNLTPAAPVIAHTVSQ